jgi:hypothetical protein
MLPMSFYDELAKLAGAQLNPGTAAVAAPASPRVDQRFRRITPVHNVARASTAEAASAFNANAATANVRKGQTQTIQQRNPVTMNWMGFSKGR